MGWYNYHPEVNCQTYGATFALCIIPLAPHGGDFRCRRHHTYDTQSLLYRVTGTSEADFTSGPRTRNAQRFRLFLGLLRHRAGWIEAWIQPIYHLLYAPIIWSVPHSRIVRLSQQGSRSQYITVTNFRFLVMSRMVDIFIPHPLPAVI